MENKGLKQMKILIPLLLVLFFSACDSTNEVTNPAAENKLSKVKASDSVNKELVGKTVDEYQEIVKEQKNSANKTATGKPDSVALYDQEVEKGFLPLKWEGLIAPGYDADSIVEKYNPIIKNLEEGSDEAIKLYEKMQAEYNKAPPNELLANKNVSIPGFIAPLEQSNGIITEFLLVPYFGACIHQPAPPANQTVHVKTASNAGIRAEEAYDPIWVSGELLIDKSTTDIGSASYKVKEAKIQKYDIEN